MCRDNFFRRCALVEPPGCGSGDLADQCLRVQGGQAGVETAAFEIAGQDVRYLDGTATPVAERDEVRLLPAMAGG